MAVQLWFMWGNFFGQIDRDGHNARLLESIVARTCRDTTRLPYVNVIAIDPAFRGRMKQQLSEGELRSELSRIFRVRSTDEDRNGSAVDPLAGDESEQAAS